MEKCCADFDSRHKNQTVCKTLLDDNFQEKIRAAFWMNPDEKICAAEILFGKERELFGVAVSPSVVRRKARCLFISRGKKLNNADCINDSCAIIWII